MKKVSLRKEITSILDNATLKNGFCITEVTNEQGFKCVCTDFQKICGIYY